MEKIIYVKTKELRLTYINKSDKDFENSKPVLVSWIGHCFYTPKKFIKECEKYGFSRAIPPHHFSSLMIGAKILFVMKGGKTKHKLIAEGIVDGIIAPNEITKRTLTKGAIKVAENPGIGSGIISVQKRGCGIITIIMEYKVSDWEKVEEVVKEAKDRLKKTNSKIFLVGHLTKVFDNAKVTGIHPTRIICWATMGIGSGKIQKEKERDKLFEYDRENYILGGKK